MSNKVRFTTNIDAAKRIVYQLNNMLDFGRINNGPADHDWLNPLVGDTITVYRDGFTDVDMVVTNRQWTVNDSGSTLEIYLEKPNHFENISDFSEFLERRNIPIH